MVHVPPFAFKNGLILPNLVARAGPRCENGVINPIYTIWVDHYPIYGQMGAREKSLPHFRSILGDLEQFTQNGNNLG